MKTDKVKAQLSNKFEKNDLNEARKILGMEIVRDMKNGKLCLLQLQYLEKVVIRFGMENSKSVSSPLAVHFKFLATMAHNSKKEVEYMA